MLFSKILSNYKSTLDSRYLNLILNIQIKLNKPTVTNNYFEKILENSNKKSNERKNLRGKVDIIIPIYNSYEYVVRCVESVLKNSTNCRIIIIDDASTEKNIQSFLDQLTPKKDQDIELQILRNQKNLGFVKTLNRACDYVNNHFVSLNSDTEVPPNWLDRLFSPIFENENQVASVTPFANSTTFTSFPNPNSDNPLFKGLDYTTIDKYFNQFGFPVSLEIPIGIGFCLAINKKVLDEIGFFDEIYGKGYAEEADWSMRAEKKGYTHVIASNLFIFHNHGTSFESKERKSLLEKNNKIFLERYPSYREKLRKFVLEDKLRPLRDIYCILIDVFSSSEKKLVLALDSSIETVTEKTSDTIGKVLKDHTNVMYLKYNFQEKTLFLNYHGFVTKELWLHNTNPDNFLQKIISFFSIDQIIINQGDTKKPKFIEAQKDEIMNFFKRDHPIKWWRKFLDT